MAAHMDMQSVLWEMYMAMDPNELDVTQLEYEMRLRDIPIYGQHRRRAKSVTQNMFDESNGNRALDHLFRSPIPVEIDLDQCTNLARYLDTESRKKRIDFRTLNTLWSRVVHLTARLSRIITAGEAMKQQKFQMLFWTESIRERIERQRDPHDEFIPAVEIDARFQRVPSPIENVETTESVAPQPTQDEGEMNDIIRRMNDVSPIERFPSAMISTPQASSSAIRPILRGETSQDLSTLNSATEKQDTEPTQSRLNSNPILHTPRLSSGVSRVSKAARKPTRWAVGTPQSILDMIQRDEGPSERDWTAEMPLIKGVADLITLSDEEASPNSGAISTRVNANPVSTYTGTVPKQLTSLSTMATASSKHTSATTSTTYTVTNTAPIACDIVYPLRGAEPQPMMNEKATALGADRVYSPAVYEALERRKLQRERASAKIIGARHSMPPTHLQRSNASRSPPMAQETKPSNWTFPLAAKSKPRKVEASERRPSESSSDERANEIARLREVCQQMATLMQQQHTEHITAIEAMKRIQCENEAARQNDTPGRRVSRRSNNVPSRQSGSAGASEASDYVDTTDTRERTRRGNDGEQIRNANRGRGSPDDSPSDSDRGSERRSRRRDPRTIRRNQNRDNRNGEPIHRTPTYLKPPPINQWKVCFSGDPKPVSKYDVNLHKFIGLVKCYCQRAHISEEAILEHILHLLAGSALDWYQNEGDNIHTWAEFVSRLKAHFLPLSHDFELIAQANRRKQGKRESVAIYVNAMRLIFGAMSDPLKAEHQLFLVRQNLHPQFSSIVASHSPRTINDVLRICKEIECSKNAECEIEATKPKFNRPTYRGVNVAEKIDNELVSSDEDNSSDSEREKSKVAAVKVDKKQKPEKRKPATAKKEEVPVAAVEAACYNCGSEDHLQRNCKLKWPKHCFRCGAEGVILRDCPKCRPELAKMAKNAKVGLAEEQPDSQNQSAPQ